VDAEPDELRAVAEHVEAVTGAVRRLQSDGLDRLRRLIDEGGLRGLTLPDEGRLSAGRDRDVVGAPSEARIAQKIEVDRDLVPHR